MRCTGGMMDSGEGSNSTHANNLVRVVLVIVVRVAIGQVHVPRVVSVVGNGRAGPGTPATNFVSLHLTVLGLQHGRDKNGYHKSRIPTSVTGRSRGTRRIQTHALSPDRIKTHYKLPTNLQTISDASKLAPLMWGFVLYAIDDSRRRQCQRT